MTEKNLLALPENMKRTTQMPWKVRSATFCDDGTPSYEVVMPVQNINACDARLIAGAPMMFAALVTLAQYDDSGANVRLDEEGSYAAFDEPSAVALARTVLARISELQ